MLKKRNLVYIALAASILANLCLILSRTHRGMLYGAPENGDVLRQLNEKTYAEGSTTAPVIGSPVQYFIFKDERRAKILYVFKYKDNITSEVVDAEP